MRAACRAVLHVRCVLCVLHVRCVLHAVCCMHAVHIARGVLRACYCKRVKRDALHMAYMQHMQHMQHMACGSALPAKRSLTA